MVSNKTISQQNFKSSKEEVSPPVKYISKNSKIVFIIFGVLLIVIIAFIAFVLGRLSIRKTTVLEPPSSPHLNVIPSPKQEEIDNWKVYSNEDYGFKAKYHANLKLQETPGDGETFTFFVSFGTLKDDYSFDIRIKDTANLDFYKWELEGHVTDRIDSQEEILVDGVGGVNLTYQQFLSTDNIYFSRVIVNNNNIDYIITAKRNDIDLILASFKFIEKTTPSPFVDNSTGYIPGQAWHTVFNTTLGLNFCLPPKWDFTMNGDGSFSGQLTYFRDEAYAPKVAYIQSIPYNSGSRREAYFSYWEKEYPNVRELVTVSDVIINSNSALLISPALESEGKYSPEGLTVVWFAGGKLWKANIDSWSYINDSQSAFLKDFYTVISCSF